MNIILEKFSGFESYFLFVGKLNRNDKNKINEKNIDKEHFISFFPIKKKFIGLFRRILRLFRIPIPQFLLYPLKQNNFTKKKISKICKHKKIDIVWLNYVWNYDYISLVDKRVLKVIDTHDIQSEIVANSINEGNYFPSKLNFETECEILKKFDLAIAISKRDYNAFKYKLNDVYYLPFYFKANILTPNRIDENKTKNIIGFIGGDADFNVTAVKRLLERVIPLCKTDFKLYIFGKICNKFINFQNDRVELKGLVENIYDAYGQVDIMINPVSFGSGLKTKCIESMAYGIPLITTSVGAQGIEDASGDCFLVGDTDMDLARCIDTLIDNSAVRAEMSAKQIKYVNENFGDKNYNDLTNKLISLIR